MAYVQFLRILLVRRVRFFCHHLAELFVGEPFGASALRFGCETSALVSLEIAVDRLAADFKMVGRLDLGAAFVHKANNTFTQLNGICFHAEKYTPYM